MYCTKQEHFYKYPTAGYNNFNARNSSHLEDWLIDVETTTNLTSKLAQAKSKD